MLLAKLGKKKSLIYLSYIRRVCVLVVVRGACHSAVSGKWRWSNQRVAARPRWSEHGPPFDLHALTRFLWPAEGNYRFVQRKEIWSIWRGRGWGAMTKVPSKSYNPAVVCQNHHNINQALSRACAMEGIWLLPLPALPKVLARKRFSPLGTVWRLFSVNTEQRAWKNPTTTINHSGRTQTASPLPHQPLCSQTTTWAVNFLKTGTEAEQLLLIHVQYF